MGKTVDEMGDQTADKTKPASASAASALNALDGRQQSQTTPDMAQLGKGLALPGLIIGLLTGIAIYGIVEYWIDENDGARLGFTALLAVATASAAYLLLAETRRFVSPLIGALFIAGLLAGPDYFMTVVDGNAQADYTPFPAIFWFGVARGLVAYLLVTLFKAMLEEGAPPPYSGVFFHGVTMPLISAGANVFAILALILLFAWARLLKEMDVTFFNELFQEPWFILPFLGAIGGLSIAMMRGQQAVLGALRYVILLFCRIAMPITAALTITLFMVLAAKGPAAVYETPAPSTIMICLAFAGMLIFNGVYQNGEAKAPALWLRLSTIVALIGFPVYALLAFHAFSLRVEEYGLTPPRVIGLAITFLAAAYSAVCIAGLVSELNWRARRWMAPVGPLNTLMAVLWVVVLTGLATPFANPWALSADSQYARIANQKTSAKEFDYGYLRFKLGPYGENALTRLEGLNNHPEATEIRAGIARARQAPSYWAYKYPDQYSPIVETPVDEGDTTEAQTPAAEAGPLDLELNPEGAPEDDPQ
ncbi:MAG: hypothetical protein AAGA09_04660 [Pseudomonadota bacterium]